MVLTRSSSKENMTEAQRLALREQLQIGGNEGVPGLLVGSVKVNKLLVIQVNQRPCLGHYHYLGRYHLFFMLQLTEVVTHCPIHHWNPLKY